MIKSCFNIFIIFTITLFLTSFCMHSAYAFEEAKCINIIHKTCLDDSEKIIEGFRVKECWKYKEIFKCISSESNHCASLEDNRGCNEIEGKCLTESQTGLCKEYEKKFVCSTTLQENQEVKLVDSLFTVLRDEQDLEKCDPNIKNAFCEIVSEECTEPAETRNINGKDIYKDCWKWDRKYQCRTNTTVDDCKEYREKGCTEIGKECIHEEEGRCEHYIVKYECNEKKTEQIDCIASKFCIGDICEEHKRNANNNFGLAASYLSVLSGMSKDQQNCVCNKEIDPNCELRSVDESTCQLFKGSEETCRKYTGEFNCCANRGFLRKIATCNEGEKDLARKREAKLCHFVGSWREKGLINKFKKHFTFCCFNSVLAKIIQEQGRAQIGKSWGDARSPDCSALLLDEIKRIDFSKIDFSSLYEDLSNKAKDSFGKSKEVITKELQSYQNNPQEFEKAIKSKMERFYEK